MMHISPSPPRIPPTIAPVLLLLLFPALVGMVFEVPGVAAEDVDELLDDSPAEVTPVAVDVDEVILLASLIAGKFDDVLELTMARLLMPVEVVSATGLVVVASDEIDDFGGNDTVFAFNPGEDVYVIPNGVSTPPSPFSAEGWIVP